MKAWLLSGFVKVTVDTLYTNLNNEAVFEEISLLKLMVALFAVEHDGIQNEITYNVNMFTDFDKRIHDKYQLADIPFIRDAVTRMYIPKCGLF